MLWEHYRLSCAECGAQLWPPDVWMRMCDAARDIGSYDALYQIFWGSTATLIVASGAGCGDIRNWLVPWTRPEDISTNSKLCVGLVLDLVTVNEDAQT